MTRVLSASLRWLWSLPAIAIGLVAVASQCGRGWLLGAVGLIVLVVVGVLAGLVRVGRRVLAAATSGRR